MSKKMNDNNEEKVVANKNLLQIRNFSMAFGENVLFSNFDFDFEPGIYVFVGPSGVGKSTLMRIIAGLETGYTGDVILNGVKMTSYSPEIHMMHQHYTSFPWLNVLDNALMVYEGHDVEPTAEDIGEAMDILERLGIGEHLEKYPSQISGGQAQRLSFARAMIDKWSKIVMYDEPTSALDEVNDMLVVEMIKEHQKKYGTIEIIITHEDHVAEGLGATILDFTPEFRMHPPKVEPILEVTEEMEAEPHVEGVEAEVHAETVKVEALPTESDIDESENAQCEEELPSEEVISDTAEPVKKEGETVNES